MQSTVRKIIKPGPTTSQGARETFSSEPMLRQDFTIAWLQVDYAIAFFILIALRSWNLISVDAMMDGSTRTASPARMTT